MGPKYEFTGETMNHDGHLLHRIKRLSDGKIGGWIEKEENLSQDGRCWVYDEAKVYDNAIVYGNVIVFDNAEVFGNAKVCGGTVYDDAKVFGNAKVCDYANVYGNAKVYGNALVEGGDVVSGNAQVYGDADIYEKAEVYDNKEYYCDEESSKEVVQYFIYKVDDSNKIAAQTEYDSVDEFFSTSVKNDIKLDTLIICAVDTKEPLIKLQKVESDNKIEFKFIVDITNEDGDNFTFKSIIKSQEQLNQLVQQTIDMLKQSPQFVKYVEDLAECL